MNLKITGLNVDGGEGSRGGKVIGHTSSGKPIYSDHGHQAHASFSFDDHREAAMAHDTEAMKHTKIINGMLPGKKGVAKIAQEHHKIQAQLHMGSTREMRDR